MQISNVVFAPCMSRQSMIPMGRSFVIIIGMIMGCGFLYQI